MSGSSVLQKNITALAGREFWLEGQKLFQEGAVLDVRLAGSSIESRVVEGSARFERVRMTYSDHHVACKCSCSRGRGCCPHAVAALLEFDQQQPGALPFLYNPDYEPTLASWAAIASKSAESAAPGAEEEKKEASGGSRKVASLKKILEQMPTARLEISVDGEGLSTMESRWEQVTLTVQIAHQGKTYAGSNLKRLIEGTGAAGKMTLNDFSPREQQIIRYLVYNTNSEQQGFVAGAYELSDIMHCMAGRGNLSWKGGRYRIHPERLRALLVVSEREDGSSAVLPRILLPDHGVFDGGACSFVAGRGGYWVGLGGDFWWLPGYLAQGWLRLFLQGAGVVLSHDELERLKTLVADGDLPVELQFGEDPAHVQAKTVAVRPIMTLDWNDQGIQAQMEFDYKGIRVGKLSPQIIPVPGEGFVCRDEAFEKAATDRLLGLGFAIQDDRDPLLLDKPFEILKFVTKAQPALEKEGWQVFFSRRFRRKAHGTGRVVLELKPGPESEDWFDLGYRLVVNRRTTISWADAVRAVESGKTCFFLPDGSGVAGIDKGLAKIMTILQGRVREADATTLRFGRYAAIPVGEIVEKYWKGTKTLWQGLRERLANPVKPKVVLPPTANFTPREYQLEGTAWITMLAESGFHGILADEMGLGKTLQALMALDLYRHKQKGVRPSLVVCPTSLIGNWHAEAARFFPHLRTFAVHNTMKDDLAVAAMDCDLVITSYALVRRDVDAYRNIAWGYLILDEAQHIKNHRTANAVSCKAISAAHRLILTGTPLENNLGEIWSLFDFLLPGLLGNAKAFHNTYVLAENSAEASQWLSRQIRPFILRRTKAEVCAQLPPKIEQVLYCDMDEGQRRLYEQTSQATRELLRRVQTEAGRSGRMDLLAMLLRLRQICCHPELLPEEFLPAGKAVPASAKMELAHDVILEALDDDHRILIFSQFTSVLAILRRWLDESGIAYEYLDGSTKDRMERVERFNKDKSIPIFLLSLKAGGTGLNLTGADTVIHYDQWWNPMVENQATDRSHRIGQDKPVTSIKLVVRDTIEERVLVLQDSKRELFNQLLSGAASSIADFSDEDIAFLLKP